MDRATGKRSLGPSQSCTHLRFSVGFPDSPFRNHNLKLESECAKILLAADEPDVCSLYGQMLEGNEYDFRYRIDGQDALEIAFVGSFDLLVLDLNAPRLDGFKVMARLKEAGKVLPVIVMTEHFLEQVVEDHLEGLQVVEFLRNPVMVTTCFERSPAGDLVYSDGSNR